MIKWLEKNRKGSLILTLLIAIEIFLFSSRTGSSFSGITTNAYSIIYHFVVFFLFNFFLLNTIDGSKKIKLKTILIALVISTIYALSDEFHQSFILGRSCSLEDILTDMAGIPLSIIIYIINKNKNKK